MKTVDFFKKYSVYTLLVIGLLFTSCSNDDDNMTPPEESETEVITNVELIFTNANDPQDVVEVHAEDPDGEGVKGLEIEDDIVLDKDKTYNLTFEILNTLAEEEAKASKIKSDGDDEHGHEHGEDIKEEIEAEDHEHQFFFSFTEGAFSNPKGNGNIDKASDPINYSDKDENGNNVGLETTWTTSSNSLNDGEFTVRLQHQPDGIKTATSGATDGDTDFELTFVLKVK